MVHQIMLLQIELKSGYIATHITGNGFSPATAVMSYDTSRQDSY